MGMAIWSPLRLAVRQPNTRGLMSAERREKSRPNGDLQPLWHGADRPETAQRTDGICWWMACARCASCRQHCRSDLYADLDPYGSVYIAAGTGGTSYGFLGLWSGAVSSAVHNGQWYHIGTGRMLQLSQFPNPYVPRLDWGWWAGWWLRRSRRGYYLPNCHALQVVGISWQHAAVSHATQCQLRSQ
jgi:hypothetical protein